MTPEDIAELERVIDRLDAAEREVNTVGRDHLFAPAASQCEALLVCHRHALLAAVKAMAEGVKGEIVGKSGTILSAWPSGDYAIYRLRVEGPVSLRTPDVLIVPAPNAAP